MNPGGRILALGGHEFNRRSGNDAIVEAVVELADSSRPRVCLLPTASGDPEDQIASFRRSFGGRGCVPSSISLFRLGIDRIDVREHLMAQDVIYAGGGSMVNLVAIWRAHGLDRILRECWEEGILICGQSARRDVLVRARHHLVLGRARRRRGARPAARQRLRPLPVGAAAPAGVPARGRFGRDAARARDGGPDRRPVRGTAPGRDDRRSRGRRGLARGAGRRWTGRGRHRSTRGAARLSARRRRAPGDRRPQLRDHRVPRDARGPHCIAEGAARGGPAWTRARRRRQWAPRRLRPRRRSSRARGTPRRGAGRPSRARRRAAGRSSRRPPRPAP